MPNEARTSYASAWIAAGSLVVAVFALAVANADSQVNREALQSAVAAETAAAEANALAAEANAIAEQAGVEAGKANDLATEANSLASESNQLQESAFEIQRSELASEVQVLEPDDATLRIVTGPGSGAVHDVVVLLAVWDRPIDDLEFEPGDSAGSVVMPDPQIAWVYQVPALMPCETIDVAWPESERNARMYFMTFVDANSAHWSRTEYGLASDDTPPELEDLAASGLAALKEPSAVASWQGSSC